MAQRTTTTAVGAILGNALQIRTGNWDGVTDLQPYVDMASSIVDQAVSLASSRRVSLSSTAQELMERWTAAHCYTVFDPLYQSRSTQGASGSFIRSTDGDYKKMACSLDPSGSLSGLLNNKVAFGGWLGKVPNDQIDAVNRSSI